MADMERPSSFISVSLSLLEKQEKEYKIVMNRASLKDYILSLKLGLRSLETFGDISTNKGLKRRIRRVGYDVMRELQSLSGRPIDGNLIKYLDSAYSNLQEKMKDIIINPKTGEYDVIFVKLRKEDTYLKRTYDYILKSLGELSSSNANLNAPPIKEKLLVFRALLAYIGDTRVCITNENQRLLTPLVDFLDKAACLLYSCLVGKKDEEMKLAMKHNLANLLEKNKVKEIYLAVLDSLKLLGLHKEPLERGINLLDNLMKLLDCTSNSIIDLNDACEKLHDKLKFLTTYLANLPRELKLEKSKNLESSIKVITSTVIDIFSSYYDKYVKEGNDMDMNGALNEVIDQIDDIQTEGEEIKLYNFPKTDALGFLDLFLEHLEELLECRPELIKILKSQIEPLKDEFDSLRSFLEKIKDKHGEHEELKNVWTRIIHLAYQAEHVIDSYLVKGFSDHRIMLTLSKIVRKIELIQSEVTRLNAETHVDQMTSSNVPSQATVTMIHEVVGFEDESDKIMEYLVGDMKQLDVISIVGMPGLGKTTLAKKMYEDSSVVQHFHVRAWCSVSQTYRKRELLLTILGDVIKITDEIKELADQDLVEKLCKSLRRRRYLIIIDDLWDIMDWNDLRSSFPDDNCQSRILITSRLQNAAPATKSGCKVHYLRTLSIDKSRELFWKRLCKEEAYDKDFLEVGARIADNCNGLPLAIVVIAGLLAKVGNRINEWKKIAESLHSHIFSDSQSQCKAIFELSYDHLPDHLKSCFLYFGVFAEDEEILLKKLKRLWIAEGFVQNTKSLDDVAEEYFMDLVNRSLVIASVESSFGRVKTCRVHDLVLDFCLEKAQEERFLQVIRVDDGSEFEGVYDQHRLRIYWEADISLDAMPYGFSVRSLLYPAGDNSMFGRRMSFAIQNFKLLRVLDLTSTLIYLDFRIIESLIHLKYLAVCGIGSSITPSISNLWNLQSFVVEANHPSDRETINVPDSLWDMVNLRHVRINYRVSFEVHANRLEKSCLLDNLETLSTPCLVYGEDAENLLKRLPKLRKLRCEFIESWDESHECCRFPILDFLDQLISLKVIINWPTHSRRRCVFNFPSNLQKLTLSHFQLSWDDISRIAKTLPNLKVLKLNDADGEKTWTVEDGDFPKLIYLKINGIDRFCNWNASEDSFPVLEQLVLDYLWDLEEIPSCFGEITTLVMITVKDCNPSVEESARTIQIEQQEELQNKDLKVYIYPREQDHE